MYADHFMFQSFPVPGWKLQRRWQRKVWPIATWQYTQRCSTNKRSKKCFTNSQHWDSAADGLAQSLDSPVIILDLISVTSDVRALEPRTRWVWIRVVFFFFPISQERGPPAS